MMAFLTRPKFQDGGPVVPPEKPSSDILFKRKINNLLTGFYGTTGSKGFLVDEIQSVLDEAEKKIHIEDSQDVSEILSNNKRDAIDQAYKMKGFQDAKMYKVASIPLIVVQQLSQKGIMYPNGAIKDKERMKKWLNDPDNKNFRIYQGKL